MVVLAVIMGVVWLVVLTDKVDSARAISSLEVSPRPKRPTARPVNEALSSPRTQPGKDLMAEYGECAIVERMLLPSKQRAVPEELAQRLSTLRAEGDELLANCVVAKIAKARRQIAGHEGALVVVGQVSLENGELEQYVVSQMEVIRWGFFVTTVQSADKPLWFAMLGHDPKGTALDGQTRSRVMWLGETKLVQTLPQHQATLRGRVSVPKGLPLAKVSVIARACGLPVNMVNGLADQRAFVTARKQTLVKVDSSGEFELTGLSPLTYCVFASSRGVRFTNYQVTLSPGAKAHLPGLLQGVPVTAIRLTPGPTRRLGDAPSRVAAAGPPYILWHGMRWGPGRRTGQRYDVLEVVEDDKAVRLQVLDPECNVYDLGTGPANEALLAWEKRTAFSPLPDSFVIDFAHSYLLHNKRLYEHTLVTVNAFPCAQRGLLSSFLGAWRCRRDRGRSESGRCGSFCGGLAS